MHSYTRRQNERQGSGSSFRRWLSNWGWYLLILVIWLTGVIGFQKFEGIGVSESLYRSMQLFVGEFHEPKNLGDEVVVNGWLHFARIAAPLATIATVVNAFSSIIDLWFRRFRQITRPNRRDVVLGLGSVGHALIRHLVSEGRLVTAVDQKIDASDRALADDVGLLMIEGDLSERRVLEMAYLHKAQNVYVACGSDEANIEIGALAASVLNNSQRRISGPGTVPSDDPDTKLNVHLSSTRLVADLGDARDLGFVRGKDFTPFSLKTGIARDLMVQARFVQRAEDLGQSCVHIVLCGLGDHGEALLIECLLTAYAANLDAPHITVFDKEAEHAKQHFTAGYATLIDESLPEDVRPAIRFVAKDLQTLDMENDADLKALELHETPPTAYVFACGNDLVNLSAGLRLEMAMQRLRRRAVPIHIRLWDRVIGPGDLAEEDQASLLRTFGNARQTAARLLAEAPATEALARDLHNTYLAPRCEGESVTAAQARMNKDWAELPEHVRRSNFRVARQAATKLMALGLQWRGMDSGILPRLSEQTRAEIAAAKTALDWSAQSSTGLEARLFASARAEHARWMIDRAIEGFRQGPHIEGTDHEAQRDNERRWHNLMKPFGQLRDAEKPSDLALLQTLLDRHVDSEAPLAHWRKVTQVSLDAPKHIKGEVLADATELEVTIAASSKPAQIEALATLEQVVMDWRRGNQACRLHLRLGTPIRELQTAFGARSSSILPELRNMLAQVANEGLILDITRLESR
ncbi:NAD-binding protein [Tateyamaria sp. SN3-11]|uniref:NAD-binding protein n=1 Tax=Tateyamaria sp. SN3-11 TaxID=3092147 RepID=UPI0039EB7064